MRRALLALVSTVAGLVLLLSFKTQPLTAPLAAAGPLATTGGASGTRAAATPTKAPATAGQTPAATSAAPRTYTGSTSQTPYGPVQVQITVTAGKLTAVTPVQLPNGNGYDQQVDTIAVPYLAQEALTAQSAHIDSVSGATYTSNGYTASLQSALDAAHL